MEKEYYIFKIKKFTMEILKMINLMEKAFIKRTDKNIIMKDFF